MKFKKLLVLLAVLIALGGLAVFKKANLEKVRKKDVGILQSQVFLEKDFSTGFVSKIDLHRGSQGDERLIFVKDASGEWRLENHYGTRARKESVEALLKTIGSLRGELRPEAEKVLNDFSLTDEQAFHFEFFDGTRKELSHILVSPLRPGGTRNFVRKASSKQILDTDTDVLAQLNIFSKDDHLSVRTFADLRVCGIESSKVTVFELTPQGQNTLVITRNGTQADPATWSLEGDSSASMDTAKINEFFAAIRNLYANESLDPAPHARDFTGLTPWLRYRMGPAEKQEVFEIWVGPRSEEKKSLLLKVTPEALVYEISLPQVEGLLKKDKSAFLKIQGT